MPRLCSDHSRSYPGRAAPCPGKWRATAMDCGEESSALTAAQQSAEVRVARCPGGPSEGPNRTDKAEGGPPRQSQARTGQRLCGGGSSTQPWGRSSGSHFTSDLNRLVRTRRLGGVGAGEGDLPGYPIGSHGSRVTAPPFGRNKYVLALVFVVQLHDVDDLTLQP